MKKNLLYMLMGGLMLSLTACSENWEDATGKHVYGENENPYLRADAAATVKTEFMFGAGQTYTVNLTDYEEVFQAQLKMSVDQAIAGIASGTIAFNCINAARGAWDRTAPNKGTSGWYFDAASQVSDQSRGIVTVELNASAKTLVITALESAGDGGTLALNVGFAMKADYDHYVRIFNDITLVDTPIELSVNIPGGDYSSYKLNFNDYADVIQKRMGMTVADFCNQLDGTNASGKVHMYVVDKTTCKWDTQSGYSAGGTGYWLNADGKRTTWGTAGFSLFVEITDAKAQTMAIGRGEAGAGVVAGKVYTFSIAFRDKEDVTKFFRFLITATMK